MKESEYQKKLKEKITKLFPGCLILKNDPTLIQGIPDLTVLYNDQYAMLEVKVSSKANVQPNQKDYIDNFSAMGVYSSFVYPENEEEVLHGLKNYFRSQS